MQDEYMCFGGPMDGKRIKIPNAATKLEAALDVEATYTKYRLWRRVEDYMTSPPTVFLQDARVLICDEGPFPSELSVVRSLSSNDWTEIPGTRQEMESVKIKSEEATDGK